MLGTLLACIVVLAIAISFRIYTQLDAAVGLQRVLIVAQEKIDTIGQIQLDQETGLRGYLASGQTLFLQPYSEQTENYDQAVADFDAITRPLGIPELHVATKDMKSLHAAWEREVARPLLKHPHDRNTLVRETEGKILVDQLRVDTGNVRTLLQARLTVAQDELRRRIDEALFGGLASVLVFGLVCILFVSSRQQMLAVIDRERSIVETLQGAFSTDIDLLPGYRIGTAYISADQDAAVGGDLYDVRRLDATRGLVVMADVSGKGIEAAVNTAFVKYSIRMLARTCADPAEILAQFNSVFLDTVRDPNLFVVTFVGILDAASQRLRYASAGHSGAYLRRGHRVRHLEVTGSIVGIDAASTYESRTLALVPGDLVLLATDGLTEARDAAGALLDDEGAMALLETAANEPQACADELVAAIRKRSGGILHDDLALLVIAIDGET